MPTVSISVMVAAHCIRTVLALNFKICGDIWLLPKQVLSRVLHNAPL